jgi:hypothetical protein
MIFYSLLLSILFNKNNSPAIFGRLNLVPVFCFICDMIENLCVYNLLINFPNMEGMHVYALVGNVATILKWCQPPSTLESYLQDSFTSSLPSSSNNLKHPLNEINFQSASDVSIHMWQSSIDVSIDCNYHQCI